jgi:hypothetical protein
MLELARNTTDTEKIIAYLQDETGKVRLSTTLERKLAMIDTAADLMKQHRSRLKVYPILMRRYKLEKRRAYQIIDQALDVYSFRAQGRSKEFYVDLLLEEIRKSKEVAVSRRDARAANQADKNMLDVVYKFFGDEEVNQFEEMLPVQVIALYQPDLTGVRLPDNWQEQVEQLKKSKRQVIDISPLNDE